MTEERNRRDRRSVPQFGRRREVLRLLAGGFLLPSLAACAHHDVATATAAVNRGRVTVLLDRTTVGPTIGPGYAGFSYEKSSLANQFFASSNRALIRLFQHLGGGGLLRLGGNSVDRTSWRTPRTAGTVEPSDVDALARFLQATGWTALYGINLAANSPAVAAAEAAYVARCLGPHLYAFEIGNEPDEYSYNRLRPPSYTYRDFIEEWRAFADVIRQAAPHARLTGPASAWHETSWTVPFAKDEGQGIVLLTQHYYRANGLSPQSTLGLLLGGDPALPGLLDPLEQASRAAGVRDGYRLTEANSFYDGGAPNVSDTYGTALWAIDFLFANVRHGSSGVNFHGGGNAPGYTPIADDGRRVVAVRPEYYGILLFALMGPGRLIGTTSSASGGAMSIYAVEGDGRLCIMLVNKEPSAGFDVEITIGSGWKAARLMRLSAPALDSVSGLTLNGAAIGADGSWSPGPAETAEVRHGRLRIGAGPASAVLVTTT